MKVWLCGIRTAMFKWHAGKLVQGGISGSVSSEASCLVSPVLSLPPVGWECSTAGNQPAVSGVSVWNAPRVWTGMYAENTPVVLRVWILKKFPSWIGGKKLDWLLALLIITPLTLFVCTLFAHLCAALSLTDWSDSIWGWFSCVWVTFSEVLRVLIPQKRCHKGNAMYSSTWAAACLQSELAQLLGWKRLAPFICPFMSFIFELR